MWNNLKFSMKVTILVCLLVLFAVLTGVGYHLMSNQIRDISIQSASDEMLDGYKSELKESTQIMASVLASATEGMTDKDEIYGVYSKLLKPARSFSDNSKGYFFVFENGVNFVSIANPKIEGKNVINAKDPAGFQHIKAIDEASKKRGGGFVEYVWAAPSGEHLPKISYAMIVPNSNYTVGTGVIVADIKEKEQEILTKITDFSNNFLLKWSGILLVLFLVIILPLVIFMIKSMTAPLNKLTEVASEYSRGEWDTEIETLDREDEIGSLSRAIKRLGVSTRMVMKKLEASK